MTPPASRLFDSAEFRQVLGHFPTGVTVITAQGDGPPAGMAIGSFASVSLDPPLVAFFPAHSSTTWPTIKASGAFCVNILHEDQEHLCRIFAGAVPEDGDRFEGLGYVRTPNGSPRLEGVLAWIDCTIEDIHPGGDHDVVIGRVHDLGVIRQGGPLLFFRGGYGRFEV